MKEIDVIKTRGLLLAGLHFVAGRQLRSGEIASWEMFGDDLVFSPRPLWSAIAYQALAFADPSSPSFERHLVGLLSFAERQATLPLVSALRWRIRTYLASQEEADFLWRRGGRDSATAIDALASAMAAEAMLAAYRPSRHVGPLLRLLGEADPAARFGILHFLSLTGANPDQLPQPPMHPTSPLLCFSAARFLRGRAAGYARESLTSAIHANSCGDNRCLNAIALSAMLDLDLTRSEMEQRASLLSEQAMEPGLWNWPSYALDGSGSPGATMALIVNVLVRSSLVAD
jgi:hypothetical protein